METAHEKFDGLEVVTFDTPASALGANAHLILGKKEAILVDAFLLPKDGATLAQEVRKTGRDLKNVFVTHFHPDHYWGLEPILKEFPKARAVASKEVSFHIKYTRRAKVMHWKPVFEDEISYEPIVPEPLEGTELELEGHKLKIVTLPPNESLFAAAVYMPSIKGVFVGDLIYNNSHLYVADVNVPESWIEAIELVKAQGPIERVYPGHGANGDRSLLDRVIKYLQDYAVASKPPATKEQMIEKMKALYPTYKMAVALCCTFGPSLSSDEFKALYQKFRIH